MGSGTTTGFMGGEMSYKDMLKSGGPMNPVGNLFHVATDDGDGTVAETDRYVGASTRYQSAYIPMQSSTQTDIRSK